jgi:hypothetical protein
MFADNGPVAAVNAMREFMEDHGSKIFAEVKEKLREKLREISPVPALLGGMEALYVIATEKPFSTAPGREATLQLLGIVATAVGTGQYGGIESRDRAWAIVAWAAHKLAPSGDEPPAPAVDAAFSTVAPVVVDPAPAPPPEPEA